MLLPAARDATADVDVPTVDAARAVLAADPGGSAPLFYTPAAFDAAGLRVLHVLVSAGADPGATVFYAPIDGGDLNGQVWLAVSSPIADLPSSFGTASCGGHPVLGPRQLGSFTAWAAECDISRMFHFNAGDRGYVSATKYYGGLSLDGLAGLTAAMTPVSPGEAPSAAPTQPRTGKRARARKRCRRIHRRHQRRACLRRANRLPL